MKIAIATGTRADWGLLSRLAKRLKAEKDAQVEIIAMNMHLNPVYGNTIEEIRADGFEPAYLVPCEGATMAQSTAMAINGMNEALRKSRPDKIVILGDRFEMLGAATAAMMNDVEIVHIAGGETTEGAIDDKIRHCITHMATWHLVSTEAYRKKVISLGAKREKAIVVGSPGVEDAVNCPLMTLREIEESLGFKISENTFLVTFHPATRDKVDVKVRFKALLDALDAFPDHPVIITYPNNDTQGQEIIDMITRYSAGQPERVKVIPSLGHKRYLSILSHVAAVIGNSSSGVIEVPSSGTPTVDIGIRQKGRIAAQSVIHCGDSAHEIIQGIEKALERGHKKTYNPYYRPDTVERMKNIILEREEIPAQKKSDGKALVIIPARGGSKGIPRKNIKLLNGRPLIHYSIDVAKEITGDEKYIIVSTEDEEIAQVAQQAGIAVPYRRPPELATDTSGSREVILDAMDWADTQGLKYDKVILLQPTSPFRNREDVEECVKRYNGDVDMVVTVKEAPCNPYYDCFVKNPEGYLEIGAGDGRYTRRQDAPKAYQLNGAVYVINPDSIREREMGDFTRRVGVLMPEERSVDIDTPEDWERAEKLMRRR